MLNHRTNRIICFAVMLIMTITALLVCRNMDRQFCMGLPVIVEEELNRYEEGLYTDIEQITFCGVQAPVDTLNNSIYISQPLASLQHFSDLKGTLGSTNRNQYLYFLQNEALDDPEKAMREGKPLIMIVAENGYFCRMNVVLTSLPIVRIHGDNLGLFNERGRSLKRGEVTVFSSESGSETHIAVTSSGLEWNVRGGSSEGYPKKSWKLALKNDQNQNKNVEFLGMGEDDDWILNSLFNDDTKIKEKFLMDTWNQYINAADDDYKMSTGEYVELVINGRYQGLYLLQRRVDQKYLGLNRNEDILLKGVNTWESGTLDKTYEIIHSPFDAERTYEILSNVFDQVAFNVDSFISADLLINFGCIPDNVGYKNMFYALRAAEQGYEMHFVPWDTDMSLGVMWINGFAYDFDKSMETTWHRREYDAVRNQTPMFDERYQARWKELRDTAFSPIRMEKHIRRLQEYLESSGAYLRDQYCWDIRWEGKDTCEALIRWCEERSARFDQLYSREIQ